MFVTIQPDQHVDIHPLRLVYPARCTKEYSKLLEKDLRSAGQMLPIYMLQGKILDGVKRVRILQRLGKSCLANTVDWTERQAALYLLHANNQQRFV
jgi:hypothetical protein